MALPNSRVAEVAAPVASLTPVNPLFLLPI